MNNLLNKIYVNLNFKLTIEYLHMLTVVQGYIEIFSFKTLNEDFLYFFDILLNFQRFYHHIKLNAPTFIKVCKFPFGYVLHSENHFPLSLSYPLQSYHCAKSIN